MSLFAMQVPYYIDLNVVLTIVREKWGAYSAYFKPLEVPLYTIRISPPLGSEK